MNVPTIITNSPAGTLALGRKLGEKLGAGSVLALTGELGSGKTLFTRGLGEGLGVPQRAVNSPTFVLVNEYRGRLPVFHMDLYRLNSMDEGIELGITDYFQRLTAAVMIIEWAEKIEPVLPENCLKIYFEYIAARKRKLTFKTTDRLMKALIGEILR